MKVGNAVKIVGNSVETGKAVTGLAKFTQLFSKQSQVAVYNPSKHQHIASGVNKAELASLKAADPKQAIQQNNVTAARNLLTAAGINPQGLSDQQLVKLAKVAIADPEFAKSWRDTATGATRPTSTVSSAAMDLILDTKAESPRLAGKLLDLAKQELRGDVKSGATNYMAERVPTDQFMADFPLLGEQPPVPSATELGFTPHFHAKASSPEIFNSIKEAVDVLQRYGLIKDIHLDAKKQTVTLGMPYQAFSDIMARADAHLKKSGAPENELMLSDGRFATYALKKDMRDVMSSDTPSPMALSTPSLEWEEKSGVAEQKALRQDRRFDAVLGMHLKYGGMDYSAYDKAFASDKLDQVDTELKQAKTGDEMIKTLLAFDGGKDGFAIGEEHSDGASKQFLHDNLEAMRKAGVKVIMIEHMKDSMFSSLISAYMQTPVGTPMPADLVALLASTDRGKTGSESFGGIIKKIHDTPELRDMRIIGGDEVNMNASKSDAHGMETRMGGMNIYAEANLRANLQDGEKYVIFAGAAHNNTHVGLDKGMPGFSQALGIVAISVESGPGGTFKVETDREVKAARRPATATQPDNKGL